MNAIYLPDGKNDLFYPSITPVNTFRVIFNKYYGTNLKLLPDLSYFSSHEDPYGFTDVSTQVDSPCDLSSQP